MIKEEKLYVLPENGKFPDDLRELTEEEKTRIVLEIFPPGYLDVPNFINYPGHPFSD